MFIVYFIIFVKILAYEKGENSSFLYFQEDLQYINIFFILKPEIILIKIHQFAKKNIEIHWNDIILFT